jgi:hypothetical protein
MKGRVFMIRKIRKKFLTKSIVSMVLILGLILSPMKMTGNLQTAQAEEKYNYAKALQLSMYFYDANMCGEGISGGALSWRGDCHTEDKQIPLKPQDDKGYGTNLSAAFISANKDVLDPDGDGYVDLCGGFHDAGDHVQFGLPQSYSGSTLGWGYYEFRQAYIDIGEQDHIENILRKFNDYFLKCTFRDKDGKVVAFAYQVGDGTSDHTYWGPPEFQTTPRPAWFATSETPASDQCAGAAASLAINYLNFKDTDPDYAEECLDTAIALYEFAKENRGLGFSGGFYNSSFDEDEMSWAAVWLNIATGDMSYIDDITSVTADGVYTGYLSRIIETTDSTWQNIWVHSWDTVWGGVFAKLAPITNDPEHWYFFRWNLEYWSDVPHEDPNDTTYMAATPAGFKVINTWGSARYNTAAQLCALVYNKYKPHQGFVDWCKSQMDYILGDNPMDRCYLVGYAENSAKHPHHRASHGSLTNSMEDPVEQKHVLWGALVGGPDGEDYHVDSTTDYVYNEVTIDYNAGFVGALAALYLIYGEGQEPDPTVPIYQVDEMPFFVHGKIEQENNERTQLTIEVTNDTSCPPRKISTLKARYFFNITEMIEKGQSIEDVSVQVMYDQTLVVDGSAVKISDPFVWDEEAGIYYIELDWSGISFHGSRELQIALVPAQDSSYKFNWDPTNDPSREGLSKTKSMTGNIPLYVDDALVYGNEPKKTASVDIKLTKPTSGTVYDYTSSQTPITLEAQVESTETKVTKVEFYADNEKIGEDTTAPYTMTYLPKQSGSAIKRIALTAKALTEDGISASSNVVNLIVKFEEGQDEAFISITSPTEGTVLDLGTGSKSVNVIVEGSGAIDAITDIEVFANGVKIGEANDSICNAIYTAPTDRSLYTDGFLDVEFTAKATLITGEVISCDSVSIRVKYSADIGSSDLKMEVDGLGSASTNTISRKFTLTNTGNKNIDLADVAIRYYFTKDVSANLAFYCDHSGLELNSAPWYESVSDGIVGQFFTMDKAVEGADTYLEISFDGVTKPLAPGKKIECEIRIANSSWANFNQENDYSYNEPNHILLLVNDFVVSGVAPK